MAAAQPPEEVQPPESQELCDVCGRLARKIKWATADYINENLRPDDDGVSIADQSTPQERPGRKRKLCSRCYSRFCRIHQSSMKAKQATMDLLVSWRRGRSRDAGTTDVFIKSEPVEPEDVWENLADLGREDLLNFEMEMAGIDQDIFTESDESSKQKRLSDLFGWGKWKLSSPKIGLQPGNRIVKNEPLNTVQISPVWICHQCNEVSSDSQTAEKHVREKHHANAATGGVLLNRRHEGLREMFNSEQHDYHSSRKYFECPICNARFEDKFQLLTHLTQTNKQTVCKVCKMSCVIKGEMDYHKSQHKSKVPGPKCIRCRGNFSDHVFFSAHQEYCNKNPPQEIQTWSGMLTCKLCRTDIHVDGITEHLLKHRGTCRICLRNFELTHELEMHSAINHKIPIFHCTHCPDIFTTSQNLNEHFKSHTNGTIPSMFRRTWPKNITTERGLQGSKNLTCAECSLVFFSDYHYRKHVDECHYQQPPQVQPSNENEAPAETNIPTNSPTSSSQFIDSKKDMKLKLFNCPICRNSYTHYRNLQNHMSKIHNVHESLEDFGVVCHRHMHTDHSPEVPVDAIEPALNPYNMEAWCHICIRDFKSKSGYSIHRSKVHRSKPAVLKRGRPNTPSINTSVQQNAELNTNYANEPEQKYRPDGKRPNLHGFPFNHTSGQNWPSLNADQPMLTRLQSGVPQRNYAHEATYRPNDEQQRTCRLCSKVMPTVRGLSLHMAWHKRTKNLTTNRQTDVKPSQLTVVSVKQEQITPEQPRMQTRSDNTNRSNVDTVPLSYRLLWEENVPVTSYYPQEGPERPTEAAASHYDPNPPEEEYDSDDALNESTGRQRYRSRYLSNDAAWKCNKCKVHLTSEALYREHKLIHINSERTLAASEDSCDGSEATTHRLYGMDVFECDLCLDKFFSRGNLSKHKVSHQTDQIEIHNDGGKYNCIYCKMRLKGEKAIMTHLSTHGMKSKRLLSAKKLPN